MLKVTDEAADALRRALEQQQEDESTILRLARAPGGMQLVVGRESDGDEILDHDGRNLLAIDADLSQELDGATIDVADTPDGPRLVFTEAPS